MAVRLSGWHLSYGKWWAFQCGSNIGLLNCGFHVELRSRTVVKSGIHYGPYLDLHLPFCVLSLGVNPAYAGEVDLMKSYSRGGINASR